MTKSNIKGVRLNEKHKKIGDILLEKRVARGWSRSELSTKLNVTHQQISKYEKGENRIDCVRLYEISKVFQCPITDFYETDAYEYNTNRATIELMRMFNECSYKSKMLIIGLVRHVTMLRELG